MTWNWEEAEQRRYKKERRWAKLVEEAPPLLRDLFAYMEEHEIYFTDEYEWTISEGKLLEGFYEWRKGLVNEGRDENPDPYPGS